MDLRRIVGSNVLGISQEELAFRANLHRTYVSGVERGGRNPTVMIVGRLAKALEVEPATLFVVDGPAVSSRKKRDRR